MTKKCKLLILQTCSNVLLSLYGAGGIVKGQAHNDGFEPKENKVLCTGGPHWSLEDGFHISIEGRDDSDCVDTQDTRRPGGA